MDQSPTVNEMRRQLSAFVENDPRNALAAHGNMKIYDAPLVGIADADDTWFEKFRNPDIIGPEFKIPGEWLAGAQTVISYFLPFTKEVRASNRAPGLPSEEWVSSRIDGEAFNQAVRAFLVDWLKSRNFEAVAPVLDPRFQVYGVKSNWSERHVAFVAGLGTFGLHKALITAKGSAGRIGSVVTTLDCSPTARNYTLFYEYCPFLVDGRCGACISRCPSQAIQESGKDKLVCQKYIDTVVLPKFTPRYGCAKCSIKVPCENRIPNVKHG